MKKEYTGIATFRNSIMLWVENHCSAFRISASRQAVQAAYTLFCLYVGYRFYCFYLWTLNQSETYTSRPSSVEGFLPISALLGLKRLVMTGQWDHVHPAGLTILIAAIVCALAVRKGFCGWICPVGFVSNILEKIGKPIRFTNILPKPLDYALLPIKYLILAFFLYAILFSMGLDSVETFLNSPYNLVADAKMLQFFLEPSSLALAVIGFLFLISLVVRNFWCRYLCPYGALLGLFAVFSPLQVKRKASLCIDCRKCENICPGSIRITKSGTVRHAECIGCMECIETCPQKDCLSLQVHGKRISIYIVPLAVIGTIVFFYLAAVLTGHWQTNISPETMKRLYQSASTFTHP